MPTNEELLKMSDLDLHVAFGKAAEGVLNKTHVLRGLRESVAIAEMQLAGAQREHDRFMNESLRRAATRNL